MKQDFEMTQQEMDDIIAINKDHPPVMKIGDNWSGLDLREKINAYWVILGDKYGFKSLTVEPNSKGKLSFSAEPKPIVKPEISVEKTQTAYKVERDDTFCLMFLLSDALELIKNEIEDNYSKDDSPLEYILSVIEVTDKEISELPEFDGF